MLRNSIISSLANSLEGDDCEIHFGESVLMPAAESYRRDRPDYDPNYDDPDGTLQFYIGLDVSSIYLISLHITENNINPSAPSNNSIARFFFGYLLFFIEEQKKYRKKLTFLHLHIRKNIFHIDFIL